MSIRTQNTQSLIDTEISDKKASDIKNPKSNKPPENPSSDTPKKTGFLRSVIQELKKVEWPTAKYVLNWSIIIIIFTVVFSLGLGFIDNIYESGVKLVGCTSPQGRNLLYEDDSLSNVCFSEFIENVTFQAGQD